MKIIKNLKRIKNSEEGVVGIVVALLLIGLFISAIAFVQTVYVPQWMNEKEAEHMDQVANQFSQLKFTMDTLSMTKQQNNPVSSPITFGSKEMPFLSSVRSYGSLDILPNDCRITITDNNGESVSYILGSIKYASENAYYIDQSYILENGALILNQNSGDIMAVHPAFSVVDMNDLSFNIVKLTGIEGKTSASGYGTYPVQTKFSSSTFSMIQHVKQITIFTHHKNAWGNYFNDSLLNSALDYSISETTTGDGLTMTFFDTENTNLPDLSLNVIEIEIQISLGWGR
jgi:cell division protein FtsL